MKSSKWLFAAFTALSLMTACQKEDTVTTTSTTGTVNPTTQTINNSNLTIGRAVLTNVEADFTVFNDSTLHSYVFLVESPNLPTSFPGLFVSGLLPNPNESTIKNGNYRGDSVNIQTFSFSQQQLDSLAAWFAQTNRPTLLPSQFQPTVYDNKNLTATVSNLRSNLGTVLDTVYRPNGQIQSIDRYTVDSATVVLGGNIISTQGAVVPVSGTLNARIKRK